MLQWWSCSVTQCLPKLPSGCMYCSKMAPELIYTFVLIVFKEKHVPLPRLYQSAPSPNSGQQARVGFPLTFRWQQFSTDTSNFPLGRQRLTPSSSDLVLLRTFPMHSLTLYASVCIIKLAIKKKKEKKRSHSPISGLESVVYKDIKRREMLLSGSEFHHQGSVAHQNEWQLLPAGHRQ